MIFPKTKLSELKLSLIQTIYDPTSSEPKLSELICVDLNINIYPILTDSRDQNRLYPVWNQSNDTIW